MIVEISFENTEIAIIFTSPESTFEQIKNCLDANVRVVCGSTGWTQQLDEIENYCRKSNGGFLYSPNFSIGVNLFYKLNDYLNEIMTNHKITQQAFLKNIILKKLINLVRQQLKLLMI